VQDGAEVTFTSPNPTLFPLPNPRYLAFHAAVAKVVHTAGMARHLDEILRKTEDIRVVSDESGVEYLDGLLRIAQRLDHHKVVELRANALNTAQPSSDRR
jgi:hypothetical protein